MLSCLGVFKCNSPRGHPSESMGNRKNLEILEFPPLAMLAEKINVAVAKRQFVIFPDSQTVYMC